MAHTHPRDLSPDLNSDSDKLKLKRLKTCLDTPPDTQNDPAPHFSFDLFDHNNIARLSAAYNTSDPFKHTLIDKLFQNDLLLKVKDECITQLSFAEKETDIYKVNQTGDLASLNYLTPDQISLLPNLLTLRDALYSPKFRSFLRAVTGSGPLSGIKQDMSVNSYTKGCHLLNHDDVIGTRRVSYILYMPLPHYQLWQKDWGGALELYPVVKDNDGINVPAPIPSKTIPPSWNQFIFFQVQPGQSFHSVEEVIIGGDEDARERLSISGWFHAAQEGEEGYVPEQPGTEYKSSREQLQSTKIVFNRYPPTIGEDTLASAATLSENYAAFLSEFLNPVYLQPRTMQALASRFVEESSLELHHFLNHALADALESRLRELDSKHGLGPNRPSPIPPHNAGITLDPPTSYFSPRLSTNTSSAAPPSSSAADYFGQSPNNNTPGWSTPNQPHQSNWVIRGPPHMRRYCILAPRPNNRPVEAVTPRAAQVSSDEILRSLQAELFPSEAFRAWLAIVAGLMPLGWLAEARRFRPGLDYTLATSEDQEARLDVVLGLTPDLKPVEDSGDTNEKNISKGWQTSEWGGWECYMAPHDEEDDPAVYRSGKSSKSSFTVKNVGTSESNGGHSSVPVTVDVESSSSVPKSQNLLPGEPSSPHIDRDTEMNGSSTRMVAIQRDEEESGEEEEESTLLTVQPGFNRLLLVLRDERVLKFVKYISAAATGSRWDICGEYEVGMVEEDREGSEGSGMSGSS